ncbi:MAG: ABC transporter ATP-binding protein, partial [Planctomycetales bacterium]|nr:ABC transporter ATP-binding protein [Planctomycetales bacterium]
MNTTHLVELVAVSKTFRSETTVAVDEVTACVSGGHVTGLVGPDGSGKTTLLRLIAGLLLPTSGEIRACGLSTRTERPAIRDVVSYMPQRFGLYEDLTVAENLSLYADLRGVVGEVRKQTNARLLDFTALAPFTNRLAGKLSGGMKQKLGLACSLIQTPKLLLLDEPSVGVDPISRRELWRLVYDLVDQGIAVIWSTAYLDEAERCGVVLALDRGGVLYDGPPGELTARVTGRSYLVRGAAHKRQALAAALRLPDVIDGVIQGSSVRLVMKEGASPIQASQIDAPEAEVVATAPRFEDAFVDLLGGGFKADSPLSRAGQSTEVVPVPQAVVEAVGLTKRFGSFTAAKDISFRIGRGEIFGLLGPNGAGKSTTFKMLCGLLEPSEGHARVVGYDLHRSGGLARAKLGYMAQKFSLYGDLSTRQNLNFFSGVYGLSGRQQRDTIERMVTAFELQPFMSSNTKDLPLGFKQRLALACAILHDPPVLFLDEPTSGVDPLTRREFWSHINAMVERGVTVLVTTHFLDEAEYCDRIALIYRGQVIAH